MYLCTISVSDWITVLFFIFSSVTSVFVVYEKLKQRANEAEFEIKITASILNKVQVIINQLNESISENKYHIEENHKSQIESDRINSTTSVRVKDIHFRLGQMSSEISNNLEKLELNLKSEIRHHGIIHKGDLKERKEECKELNKEVKGHIEKLYLNKQDKSK